MSADNWTYCPRCRERTDKLNETRIKAPGKAYGKVAQDIYLKLLEDAKKLVPYDESLREDYEIGIDKEGKFYVDYSAGCDCGFKFQYKHEEKIKI